MITTAAFEIQCSVHLSVGGPPLNPALLDELGQAKLHHGIIRH
jgi:hypothetical protein